MLYMKEGGYYPPSFAFQERNGKAFQSEVYRVYRLVAGVADEFFPARENRPVILFVKI